MARSNLDRSILKPHERADDPHPQYVLRTEFVATTIGLASTSDGLPASLAVGGAGSIGTSTKAAHHDHAHPAPGLATVAADGFMSKEQVVQLSVAGNAVVNHVASANPHPQYATDADLATHVAAADPHTGYVLESTANDPSGYAALDVGGRLEEDQMPEESEERRLLRELLLYLADKGFDDLPENLAAELELVGT